MCFNSNYLTVLLILALLISPAPATAMSCTQALEYLIPCQAFLLGVGEMSSSCCHGAQSFVRAAATSSADRNSVCQCLQKFALLSVNSNLDKAKQLPKLCKIDIPVEADVNCDAIPSSEALIFSTNQHKKMEVKAYRPTTPGNSPGIGHKAMAAPTTLKLDAESVAKDHQESSKMQKHKTKYN